MIGRELREKESLNDKIYNKIYKKLTQKVGFFVYDFITIPLSIVFISVVILKQKQKYEKQQSNF